MEPEEPTEEQTTREPEPPDDVDFDALPEDEARRLGRYFAK